MQCQKCGADNPDDAFFCSSCGVQFRSTFGVAAPGLSGLPDRDVEPDPPAGDARSAPDAGQDAALNPFSAAEPHANAAYQHLTSPSAAAPAPPASTASVPSSHPYAPGAGIAPPPPPPPHYAPPQQYAPPPPPGYAPPYPPAPGYAAPGYHMPPDGNTSGMGQGHPIPPQATGWTFAGCVPWGLFAFINGDTTWGVVGLVGFFIPIAQLVYAIYMGINGKESAWRNKRFNSLQEYQDSMRLWHLIGLGLLGLFGVAMLIYFVIFAAIFAAAISESAHH